MTYRTSDGLSIHYNIKKGSSDEAICFLHGYPTSSEEYNDIFPLITEKYTVVAHDHLGFGKSDKPTKHHYLLTDQADIALELWHSLGLSNIHIVAHDYGTSVATEIIARQNEDKLNLKIETVTLCNGSMLIEVAELRLIQRLLKSKITGPLVARLSNAKTFHRNMKNIWYDKSLYNPEEMHIHWELLIAGNGRNVLPNITRYINQRYEYYDRWIGGLKKSSLPMHILWAQNDPVAVEAMAHRLAEIIPNTTKTIIPKCGHYPMIEKRQLWTEKMMEFIEKKG